MHTLRLIIGLGFAALALYIVVVNYLEYRKTSGSTWDRLLDTARNSATILWSKFCILLAGIVGSLDSIADLAGMPELKTFIDNWLGNPKVIAGVMLALSLVTFAARKRTL